MAKAYKRAPIHKRGRKSMIPKPPTKKAAQFEGYQSQLLKGEFTEFLKKHSITKAKLLKLNSREIRKRFTGEPIAVIDRLVTMTL